MMNKVIGAAVVIGAIFGVVFFVKVGSVYLSANTLEATMQGCIQYYQNDKEGGCLVNLKNTINQEGLSLDPSEVKMSLSMDNSTLDADVSEVVDFFGIWQYTYTKSIHVEGKPPSRI